MSTVAEGWADSHCHVQSMEDPDAALARAHAAGVAPVVCVGTDVATSVAACDLAERHPDVRATVGLHPHEASRLDDERRDLEALAARAVVVAIGEAGFDLYYLNSPFDAQERAFRHQITLAKALDLPLVIHSREAWDDTFRVLESEGAPDRVVFHCFTGGAAEARRALDLGAHLSFSGIVTFPAADEVRAAAASTPTDRLLVETDAPYLAPVPHRGRVNEPAFVVHVGRGVAAALGEPEGDVAQSARRNTERVFTRR